MALTRISASEELTRVGARSQMGPTTATPTRRAPTPLAPSHARAMRATTGPAATAPLARRTPSRTSRAQVVVAAPRIVLPVTHVLILADASYALSRPLTAGKGSILNAGLLNLVPVTGRFGHVPAGYPADT